jgi:hypothetical protein
MTIRAIADAKKWHQSLKRAMSTSLEKHGKKGDNDNAPHPIVVESVMANASGALEFPTLVKGNYHKWAHMMKVNLKAMCLWNTVESNFIERRED